MNKELGEKKYASIEAMKARKRIMAEKGLHYEHHDEPWLLGLYDKEGNRYDKEGNPISRGGKRKSKKARKARKSKKARKGRKSKKARKY